MPGLTRYRFRDAASGFFELPTENARRLIPPHLEPMEVHHGTSVLSVTCFDFTESEVGPYRELVMAVVVAPLIRAGERVPKSAVFPYRLATTTRAAREHAIERWHLPHWMEDVEIAFDREEHRLRARVWSEAATLVELEVGDYAWQRVCHLYQGFIGQGQRAFVAHVTIEGEYSEHEEETGRLRLVEHPFHGQLEIGEVSEVPFRETWMREGLQTFEPLVQLEPV